MRQKKFQQAEPKFRGKILSNTVFTINVQLQKQSFPYLLDTRHPVPEFQKYTFHNLVQTPAAHLLKIMHIGLS